MTTSTKTKSKTTAKKKAGRPSLYTKALADKIIALIEEGKSESKICKMAGMPSHETLRKWKDTNPEFLARSARARQESAAKFREEALQVAQETADFADDVANGRKLTIGGVPLVEIPKGYVDAKRLLVQELNREAAIRDDSRFGDRKKVTMSGENGGPIQVKQEVGVVSSMSVEELLSIANMKVDEES